MQVGTLAIHHVFERDVLYQVPLYQRPYVWTREEQWQPLWDDIRRQAEIMEAGRQPRAHFLGASVQDLLKVPPGQIETRLLIDGQQRLTTIQLFLKAFHDVITQSAEDRYVRAIQKLISNDHPLSDRVCEQFKVWPTNADREDYQAVMEGKGRGDTFKSYGVRSDAKWIGRNIPDAYLFFHYAISDWLAETPVLDWENKIKPLYSAVRENVRLVVIDLDEKDDAQLIFETLNARGTPLLAADLVKNSLLNEIQKEGQNADTAYQKYWRQFDQDAGFWRAEVGRGHAKRARIEMFLRHAIALMTQEDVAAGHLYAAYRDYAEGDLADTPVARLEAFKRFGLIYKGLQEGHENPRIRLFLERLHTMDVGTAYPLLLKLFDGLGDREDWLVDVLLDLESFLVRRMVCRLSTRGYDRFFVDLLKGLNTSSENLDASLREALLSGTAEADRWPSDEEFRNAWVSNPLYENLTRPRLRLLLEECERGLRSEFAETHAVPRNLTIEHIMPQSWEHAWSLPESESQAEAVLQRNQLLHTVGNLTLINGRLNGFQSNRPWIGDSETGGGKREALRDHSVLYLNKQLVERETWDEARIRKRSEALFELAASAWPRPA